MKQREPGSFSGLHEEERARRLEKPERMVQRLLDWIKRHLPLTIHITIGYRSVIAANPPPLHLWELDKRLMSIEVTMQLILNSQNELKNRGKILKSIEEQIQAVANNLHDLESKDDKASNVSQQHEEKRTTVVKEQEQWSVPAFKNMARDVIALYDDLGDLVQNIENNPGFEQKRTRRSLQSLRNTLRDLLERYNVQAFERQEKTYVAGQQHIVDVKYTNQRDQDEYIAERLREGFIYQGNVLRQEWVYVYKYREE